MMDARVRIQPRSPIEVLRVFSALPDGALIRIDVVAAHEACSGSTIWRRVRKGTFPAPVRQAGVTAWRVGDIRKHHARLVQQSV
jgi:predicted DNA-binding transcriptional regulator AlpA